MINHENVVIDQISNHVLPGLEGLPIEIFPHYDGFSLGNIPSSICQWLGAPTLNTPPLAQSITDYHASSYKNVILLVVDGLRYPFFKNWLSRQKETNATNKPNTLFNEQFFFTPLTSIVPSTTSAALTTLWTGCLPAAHGIIGYELFLKEYGVIANMVFQSVAAFINDCDSLLHAGFQPKKFLHLKTMGSHLRQYGVESAAFQHANIAQSGLSKMLFKDVRSISFHNPEELFLDLSRLLEAHKRQKKYIYIYWGDLDGKSHHYGPDSAVVAALWDAFALQMIQFLHNQKKDGLKNTLFLLVADHGQIATEIVNDFDLENHPNLVKSLVMLPSGESRLPYLFIRKGQEQQVDQYLRDTWGETFILVPASIILESGLMGNGDICQGTRDRLADWVVFPKNNAYWWWVKKENHLLGRHGGLSAQEMIIPFVSFSF